MCLGLAAGYRKSEKEQKARAMTAAEAAKRIREHAEIHSKKEPNAYFITIALHKAAAALDKQTAVKPISIKATSNIKLGAVTWHKGATVYKCPCCNSFISRVSNYCNECGQAIAFIALEEV